MPSTNWRIFRPLSYLKVNCFEKDCNGSFESGNPAQAIQENERNGKS